MPSVFTTFASSRFVDRQAVVEALRRCAERLRAEEEGVVAVHLFGSFADGTATPRSDADVVIEVADDTPAFRERIWEKGAVLFLEAPVPVDLFVISSERMAQGRGVAGAVARQGVRLA